MNKIIRNILISLGAIIILVSLVGNLYYFGYKQLETNLMQKGFNIAINQITKMVKETGQAQIDKDLILIKK